MREFLQEESGHSDAGVAAILLVVVVLLLFVLWFGGLFRGVAPNRGIDIRVTT